jgi:hypothetical protein
MSDQEQAKSEDQQMALRPDELADIAADVAAVQGRRPPEKDGGERWVSQRVRPGMLVEVKYRGVVADQLSPEGTYLPILRGEAGDLWYEAGDDAHIMIIPPTLVHGCVMWAGGELWNVRRSNKRDSLRVCPSDMSGRLRTLPLEDFWARYPSATVRFDPRTSD